ncbi:MAG: BcpO-related WXXGXW repeat protein [Lentisphaerae bacterium]|nr:BcpO-related WXXGXW repeat protein [Lentisphaerota bacterium]
MKRYNIVNWQVVVACVVALWSVGAQAQVQPPLPQQEEPEFLAQGPVHEAFAEPVVLSDEGVFVVPVAPPRVVIDEAPDERPSSAAVWIAGYWAWDAERNLYIWVSGCWRVVPAGKKWVAGYWSETDQGWIWTAGYWGDTVTVQREPEYLPAPPALPSVAPPSEAPSLNVVWVPPCWYWRNNGYVLRSGYWLDATPGWVWQPSHYVRTRRGHVFVPGFWDYPLASRGTLFAPVLLPSPVIRRPSFSLSLGLSVNLGWLELNLFSAPRYGHYFFGDYYDTSYLSLGIFPGFHYRTTWGWYDSIYEHRRWSGRKGGDNRWDDRDRHYFTSRRDNKTLRPPKTYREMVERPARPPSNGREHAFGGGRGGGSGRTEVDRHTPLVQTKRGGLATHGIAATKPVDKRPQQTDRTVANNRPTSGTSVMRPGGTAHNNGGERAKDAKIAANRPHSTESKSAPVQRVGSETRKVTPVGRSTVDDKAREPTAAETRRESSVNEGASGQRRYTPVQSAPRQTLSGRGGSEGGATTVTPPAAAETRRESSVSEGASGQRRYTPVQSAPRQTLSGRSGGGSSTVMPQAAAGVTESETVARPPRGRSTITPRSPKSKR